MHPGLIFLRFFKYDQEKIDKEQIGDKELFAAACIKTLDFEDRLLQNSNKLINWADELGISFLELSNKPNFALYFWKNKTNA